MEIKKIFRRLLDRLFLRKFDDIKIQKGQLFERHLDSNLKNIKKLNQAYFKVFSQDNEDGIIQFLLKSLDIDQVKFVEIGTQNYSESNTRYIFETMRCEGLIIDPFPDLKKEINNFLRLWKNNLNIHNEYIDAENINRVLNNYSFNKNIDIFSIDIDGIDYWVLKSLPQKISKIFIIEYNPFFGPEVEISVPNIKNFERLKYDRTGFCWGASLKALINLMDKKGYSFIGTNRLNVNSFFITKELVEKIDIDLPNTDDLSKYTDAKFNIFKSKDYSLDSNIQNDVKNLEVFDLQQDRIIKLSEIKSKIPMLTRK
jgi:hypothetical protein